MQPPVTSAEKVPPVENSMAEIYCRMDVDGQWLRTWLTSARTCFECRRPCETLKDACSEGRRGMLKIVL